MQKYPYIVFDIDVLYLIVAWKKYRIFQHIEIFKNIAIYRKNIAIFSTDFSLNCVTKKLQKGRLNDVVIRLQS